MRVKLVLLCAMLVFGWTVSAQATITLDAVTHWNLNAGQGALLAKYVKEYNSIQDEVEVKLRTDVGADKVEKMLLWAIGDMMPDILPVSQVHMADLMQAGIMVPLPDYAVETVERMYYQGALDMVRYGGKLYGYPTEYIPTIFTYDTVAFTERGLSLEFPTTWDDLLHAAKILTDYSASGDITRAGLGWVNNVRSNVGLFLSLAWSSPALDRELFSDDFRTVSLNTLASRNALAFIHDLIQTHQVATQGGSVLHTDQAIRWAQSHTRVGIAREPGRLDEIRSARIPAGANDMRVSPVYGWAFIVPSTSEYAEEAHAFISWLTTEELDDGTTRMGNVLAVLGSIPVTHSDIRNQLGFQEEFMSGFRETVMRGETRPWPTPVNNQLVLSAINRDINAAIRQQKTVVQALIDAELEVQKLIDEGLK